jgi:NADPH:quinone reductase-like Zn-dependent oxidoreductase
MLVTLARVQASDRVLVLAGGSGVGQAAIQIARAFGAWVFATSGPKKLERTRALGADEVFDHYDGDYSRKIKDLTGGRGVDIVIEHVGQATWEASVKALAVGGRLVTCGNTTGWEGRIDLRFLFTRQLSLMGSYMGTRAELLRAARFFFDGTFRPVVDSVLPLREAAEAHRRLEAREQFGKIVLQVD